MENKTKICNFCSNSFEDNSRNGNKLSCSPECRIKFKRLTARNRATVKRQDPEYRKLQNEKIRELYKKRGHLYNQRKKDKYANDIELREHCKQQAKKWHRNNLERHAENCHNWYVDNFDKVTEKNMKQRDRTLPADLVRQVYEYNHYTCTHCGKYGGKLTVEHILPVIRGGTDDFDNLSLACGNCNPRKGRKTLTEYLLYLQESI